MKSLASTTGTYRSGWAEAASRVAITQKSEEIARLQQRIVQLEADTQLLQELAKSQDGGL